MSNSFFQKLTMDISRYKLIKPAKKITAEQSLCEEIWLFFQKELSFGRIMKMIKFNGTQCVREVFEETKKFDKCENPLAYFLWSAKKNKTKWL